MVEEYTRQLGRVVLCHLGRVTCGATREEQLRWRRWSKGEFHNSIADDHVIRSIY